MRSLLDSSQSSALVFFSIVALKLSSQASPGDRSKVLSGLCMRRRRLNISGLTQDGPRPSRTLSALVTCFTSRDSSETDGVSGLDSGGIKAETKQTMENIRRVLERDCSPFDQVVKM